MKAGALISTLKESTLTFWSARNERERSILMFGGCALVLFLIYAIFFGPALNGRESLDKELPALRQQAAEIRALSKQANRLSNQGASDAPAVSQEGIAASLTGRGMKPQNLSVTDGLVHVQLNPVSFAGVMDWINEQQRTAHLTVIDANFIALQQTDSVNATVTLRQQKSE